MVGLTDDQGGVRYHRKFEVFGISNVQQKQVTECVADKPVLVMTWIGQDPSLPAVMLNSHTDVVPGLAYGCGSCD